MLAGLRPARGSTGAIDAARHLLGVKCGWQSMWVGYSCARARNIFSAAPSPRVALVNVQMARGALGAASLNCQLKAVDTCTMKRRFSSPADTKAPDKKPMGAGAPAGGGGQAGLFAAIGLPVGGIAGTFGSLVGVGGGVIMVPMLTCKPLSLQARAASATSLVAVVGTGLIAAMLYTGHGQSDLPAAATVAVAAMATAPFGARATMMLSHTALKRLMGLFLLIAAPLVPLRDTLLPPSPPPPSTTPTSTTSTPDQLLPMSQRPLYVSLLLVTGPSTSLCMYV